MSATENAVTGMAGRAAARLRETGKNIVAGLTLLRRAPRAVFTRRGGAITSGRLAAGAALVAVAAVWQMFVFDAALADAVRQLPRWIGFVFRAVTDFGKSGWFLWPIGIVLLAIAALATPLARMGRLVAAALAVRLMFVFLAIGVPGLFVTIVKRLIGRARPSLTGPPFDPFSYAPLIWRADHASMPSGHATTAVAAAIAIGALWPRSLPLMWTYAAVIAVSRVVVSAHYPSDVVVGAAVGLLGALLVRNYFAARGLAFIVTEGGHVRALPGPSLARIKRVARAVMGE